MAGPRTIALPERYRVEHRIASGGMASVWAAHDEVLGRRVAVKVLSPLLGEDESYHARFMREARAVARMSDCRHVVTIYDIGEHAGRAFIVMEYLGGGTVADRMSGPGLVAGDTAMRWLREAAIALDCAHGHGIVHRDVKPANLLLDDADRLAVADFGIARLADETRRLTAVGAIVGTAAYLSPEQALAQDTTSAADRYALAVVAFELLSGERPYRAEHPTAQARQHIEAPIPRVTDHAPHLPRATDAVFARGLAKDPAERPATAGELVDDLERALREEPEPATQVTQRLTRPAAAPPARRGRGPLVVAGVVALAALIAAAVVLALGGGDEPQRRTAGTTTTTTTTRTQRTATAPPATSQAPAPAPADGRSPSQLNDAGFALNQQQRYAEAVPLLQRSVEGYRAQGRATGLPYAYALYNLAYALARTGREQEAVPLLEERLRVSDNQRGVVRRELRRIQGKGKEKGKKA